MKYCIVLRSKFTSEEIHLGSSYKSKEDASKYAEHELCKKCNYIDIRGVHESHVWVNRRDGFKPSMNYDPSHKSESPNSTNC
jgi:hypothetical protein